MSLVGNNDVFVERQRKVKIQKYVWDANTAQEYYNMYFTEEVSALFTQATELINDDVEAAVKVFNSAVKLAGLLQAVMLVENLGSTLNAP